ncbi:hypothetical protein DL771_003495 [Monosporascus sp. 5C6A]|nr:hypothetical protein DL771_003495 [Monosporascus sp. 5C6A]
MNARLALSSVPQVDLEVGLKTSNGMWEAYKDEQMRGWARPVLAINATRVGHSERTIYRLNNYKLLDGRRCRLHLSVWSQSFTAAVLSRRG